MEGGNITVVEPSRIRVSPPKPRATAAETQRFRETVKVGDYSSAGLVVEVKAPVVKVQTSGGERWFRIDELEAPYKPVKNKK